MIKTVETPNSGYRFMPGVSQYSCGIAALPGFAIERVRFADPMPLKGDWQKRSSWPSGLRQIPR